MINNLNTTFISNTIKVKNNLIKGINENCNLISSTIECTNSLEKEITESCSLINNAINLSFVFNNILTNANTRNLAELKDLTLTEAKSIMVFDLFQI